MKYIHAVDKKMIPKVKILNVELSAINMSWLIRFTNACVKKLSGDYICVSNVYTTVMSFEDIEYLRIQNSAMLSIPDGGPLSLEGRRRGAKQMRRTTGPDYMENMLKESVKYGYTHFFYGSTEETLRKIRKRMEHEYPKVRVVGMYSPPFRSLTETEDQVIVEMINRATPDFIWVGLGAPKQERWMSEHQGRVKGLMVGVGAAFDFFAGNLKRAPLWMQRLNMEWFYRLLQEPKRLLKKYVVSNTKFIWYAVLRGK